MANLQAAQLGGFGIRPQYQVGSIVTTEDHYWFMGNLFDIGPQQVLRDLGQLVGGKLLPFGQTKTGVFSGGRAVLPPLLDNYIWWIIYAYCGAHEADAGVQQGTDNVYVHTAPSLAGEDSSPPDKFLTVHKITPTDGVDVGEEFRDQTITRMQLNITGGEFVTFQFDMMGLRPYKMAATGDGWDKIPNAPKTKRSLPISALPEGGVELPVSSSIDAVQAVTIDLVNIVPQFRDVAQVGSYDPHSFPILGRTPVITLSQLYTAGDLVGSVFYDGNGDWDPEVFNTNFQVRTQSAARIRSAELSKTTDVAYGTSEIHLVDSGADFTTYAGTPATEAGYWIEVYDANDRLQSWGFCGAIDTVTKIEVYKDHGLNVRGWKLDGSSGTPADYRIHANTRYELGFRAESVDWSAAPPVLAGGDLLRVDFTGLVSGAPALLDDSQGLDWNIWLRNKTQNYVWPTS